jgi:hypothetical protein
MLLHTEKKNSERVMCAQAKAASGLSGMGYEFRLVVARAATPVLL